MEKGSSGPAQQVLRVNIGGEPTVLNPILLTDSASHAAVGMIFRSLMRRNPDLEIVPDLAESYTVSSDGLIYTFHLRKKVFWHDGRPFTSADVKFTFDLITNPKTNTVRRSHFIVGGKPVKWEIVDHHTIKAILSQPFSPFIAVMNMEILPQHLLSGVDINKAEFNRKPVGTGPFKFKEWRTGEYIRLVKNDQFYLGNPKLNEVLLKIIPDTNTALAALEKGELDLAGIPEKDMYRFEKDSRFEIFRYYGLDYSYIGFNLHKKPLTQRGLRQAIAHAVNKEAMIKGVFKGYGRPAHIPSSPLSWAYPPEDRIVKYDYDPKKSMRILKELGYQLNPKTQIFEKNGESLNLTLLSVKGSPTSQRITQIVQQYLREVGIDMSIQLMEWSAFLKILHDKKDPKDFELVMLGWRFDIDDPDDTYTVWHSSLYPKGANLNGYNNPKVDALLEQGRREMDREKRKVMYEELFNLIANDLPYLFLFHTESALAVNKKIKGLTKPGPAGVLNRIEQVWISD